MGCITESRIKRIIRPCSCWKWLEFLLLCWVLSPSGLYQKWAPPAVSPLVNLYHRSFKFFNRFLSRERGLLVLQLIDFRWYNKGSHRFQLEEHSNIPSMKRCLCRETHHDASRKSNAHDIAVRPCSTILRDQPKRVSLRRAFRSKDINDQGKAATLRMSCL